MHRAPKAPEGQEKTLRLREEPLMTYILQSKSIFWPATDDDLIIIQCFLQAVIHLIHKWGSRVLCPDSGPFHL